jgi:hypothetical protein
MLPEFPKYMETIKQNLAPRLTGEEKGRITLPPPAPDGPGELSAANSDVPYRQAARHSLVLE